QEIGHAIDAETETHVVEVGVAGLHYRLVHVDPAVALAAPVTEHPLFAFDAVETGVPDGALPVRDARLQAGQANQRFHGGAGRVLSLEGAVEQRLVVVIAVAGVVEVGNAGDKQVRVEAGPADKRQHAAVARVDGNHGTAPFAEGIPGGLLYTDVQLQAQVLARLRRDFLQHAQDAAPGVGFHFPVAGLAVQQAFVVTFHTDATGIVGAGIVGLLVGVHLFDIFGA